MTSIGECAFMDCKALATIEIPGSVSSIDTAVFDGCAGLTSVVLANGITSIGYTSFGNCSSLASVTIPDSVTIIGDSAFHGCFTLSNISIPENATSIGEYAFEYCESLISIEVPEKVASVGMCAFSGCSSMTEITIQNKDCAISNNAGTIYSGTTIYGWIGSTAESFAQTYNRTFVPLGAHYTVIFKSWNDTVLDTQIVYENDSAIAPEAPIRIGYTFTGWDKPYANITADLTITAQYTAITYEVYFLDYDKSVLSEQTVNYGDDAIAPDSPTRDGFVFSKWDADYSYVTKELIVNAVYTSNSYTVTFKDWDGKALKIETVRSGRNANPPTGLSRDGYEFTGWDKLYTNITADATLIAQYEALELKGIVVSPTHMNLQKDSSEPLTITLQPSNISGIEVQYSSSDISVATVSNGVVTAVGVGGTKITVSCGEITTSVDVVVEDTVTISNDYHTAIKNGNRGRWHAELNVDGTIVAEENIKNIKLTELEFANNKIGIGNVTSSYVNLKLRNIGMKLTNKVLTFKIGMSVGDSIEYVQFGNFYVSGAAGRETDEVIDVTAYDSVIKLAKDYTTSLTYPASAADVAKECASMCGLSWDDSVEFPTVTIKEKLTSKTHREAVGVIAQLAGANVVANRNSKLEFRWLNTTDIIIDAESRYYDFDKDDLNSYIRTVKCENANGTFTHKNSASEWEVNAIDISIINEYMNQELVDKIGASMSLTYTSGNLPFLGDPSICVGDIITVQGSGKENTREAKSTFNFPVMQNVIEYDGGVKNTTDSYAESEEAQSYVKSSTGSSSDNTSASTDTSYDYSDIGTAVDDYMNDYYGGDTGGGGSSGYSGFNVESVSSLPANPDGNTIYLIRGEVVVG